MPNKTQGQIESEITEKIIEFEKQFMGRGPSQCKTYLIDDMVLVRLKGAITAGEQELLRTAQITLNGFQEQKCRELIKSVRREVLEKGKNELSTAVQGLTGQNVISTHTDLSTISGERVIIFVLERVPEVLK